MTKRAFTLAEILITLGIVGVVAALTIPTLINNYQKRAAIVAAKKAYSTLEQAYLQITNENDEGLSVCPTNNSKCLADLFAPILKSVKGELWIPNSEIAESCWEDTDVSDPHESHYCMSTADGMTYDFDMEHSDRKRVQAKILVDVNGLKKPNVFGKDRFAFIIYDSKVLPSKDSSSIYQNGYFNAVYNCQDGKTDGKIPSFKSNFGCTYKYIYEN